LARSGLATGPKTDLSIRSRSAYPSCAAVAPVPHQGRWPGCNRL